MRGLFNDDVACSGELRAGGMELEGLDFRKILPACGGDAGYGFEPGDDCTVSEQIEEGSPADGLPIVSSSTLRHLDVLR